MLYNPFKFMKKREWLLWEVSLLVVTASGILSPEKSVLSIIASQIGVTALIFVARGDVWGEILSFVFAIFYMIVSIKFRYWGEVLTYMGMTAPMAVISIVSWLKNPYAEDRNEVKISRLDAKKWVGLLLSTVVVTALFGYMLYLLKTPNLVFSIISIATSFAACYLTFFRNSYYAIAYALNDVVLIVLWVLASAQDRAYIPIVTCFVMFLVNDIYGFVSWKSREKKQSEGR